MLGFSKCSSRFEIRVKYSLDLEFDLFQYLSDFVLTDTCARIVPPKVGLVSLPRKDYWRVSNSFTVGHRAYFIPLSGIDSIDSLLA